MAIVSVNLVDTFDEWRVKTNTLGTETGDLSGLSTSNTSSIVAALNEIDANADLGLKNIVEDTTPELGGPLNIGTHNINGSGTNQSITLTGVSSIITAGRFSGIIELSDDPQPELAANLNLSGFDITGTGNINITGSITATSINAPVGGDVTGTVSNITIPANSITSAMIAPGVIVAQDIAANAVNGTHLAMGSDVAGDTIYYNGTDYTRLAKGTVGQIMIQGTNAPEWTTTLAGTVTGVTQSVGDNSTRLATTAYADASGGGGGGGGISLALAIAVG